MRKHDDLGFDFDDIPDGFDDELDEITQSAKMDSAEPPNPPDVGEYENPNLAFDDTQEAEDKTPVLEGNRSDYVNFVANINDELDKLELASPQTFLDLKPVNKAFSVALWEPLILEVLLHPTQLDLILDDFGISREYYDTLCTNEVYKKVKEGLLENLPEIIKGGGFSLSAYRLAGQSMAVLSDIIQNATDDSTKLSAIKLAAQYSGLDPMLKTKQEQAQNQGSSGLSVVVNLGAGLKVPEAFLGERKSVIDIEGEEV